MRPRSRRRLRIIAVAAVTVVILIGAVLIGGAMIFETPSVTAQIQREISQAIDGKVSWDTLQVRFLPAPRAVLHNVHVEISGQAQVQVEEASAYLRLWPLLHGDAQIRSMTLVKPVVRIDVVDFESQRSTATLEPIAAYRSIMTSAVHAMRDFAPDTVLSVDNGSVEVHAPDASPVRFRDLTLRARTGYKGIEIEMATVSSFSGPLQLSARLEFADLSGHAELDVADLKPQVWLDQALRDAAVGITVLPAKLHAVFRTDGKTLLQCDVALDIPSLTVARGGQRLQIPDIAL